MIGLMVKSFSKLSLNYSSCDEWDGLIALLKVNLAIELPIHVFFYHYYDPVI